jgi:hypothetical protein
MQTFCRGDPSTATENPTEGSEHTRRENAGPRRLARDSRDSLHADGDEDLLAPLRFLLSRAPPPVEPNDEDNRHNQSGGDSCYAFTELPVSTGKVVQAKEKADKPEHGTAGYR